MDSIAKAVIFYAGGQCTLRPKFSWKMWRYWLPYLDDYFTYKDSDLSPHVKALF